MNSAKVIADSISVCSNRLTSIEGRLPKFILAQLNTHKSLSKNASSSRAIPIKQCIREASSKETRAIPSKFGKAHPGMLATEWFEGDELELAQLRWEIAANRACNTAQSMLDEGMDKQATNRVLDSYIHSNVLITGTDDAWLNFFGLRLKDADPTMEEFALKCLNAYNASVPDLLTKKQWHLPYVDLTGVDVEHPAIMADVIKISISRCARVSYKSFVDQKPSTLAEDLTRFELLLNSRHLSPFEHIATPDESVVFNFTTGRLESPLMHRWGNFVGWHQYRQMIQGQRVAKLAEGFKVTKFKVVNKKVVELKPE